MQRVAVIYNPASGQNAHRRAAVMGKVLALVRQAGHQVQAFETDAPGSARTLAHDAAGKGFDTILACGGDGTVHEVLQAIVGTSIALGVVPLGTANALAQDLGLGRSPLKAVRTLLTASTMEVPVGRIWYRGPDGVERWRYFTVAAGVGADALLMSRLDAGLKRRLGYLLYLVEAARIWATDPFPLFEADFQSAGSERRTFEVSQLLAVRVRSFGGVLGCLAPGAALRSGMLHLLAFRTRSRMRYLRFLLAVIAGRHTFSRHVELIVADRVECRPRNRSHSPVFVEADGELLGGLPVHLEVAPESLMLLVPPGVQP